MSIKKRIGLIASAVLVVALVCVVIFYHPLTTPVTSSSPAEKKAELQEQLADELQKYYLGSGNYQECQKLIEEIEQY